MMMMRMMTEDVAAVLVWAPTREVNDWHWWSHWYGPATPALNVSPVAASPVLIPDLTCLRWNTHFEGNPKLTFTAGIHCFLLAIPILLLFIVKGAPYLVRTILKGYRSSGSKIQNQRLWSISYCYKLISNNIYKPTCIICYIYVAFIR